jgi:hypothetical protein
MCCSGSSNKKCKRFSEDYLARLVTKSADDFTASIAINHEKALEALES